MPLIMSAFASGLLFGLGLVISQMINPAKVIGFLDVFGTWDPSLAFVMAGAVIAAAAGWFYIRRRGTPILVPKLEIPARRDLDLPLLAGAAIFGVGWGLAGLCPGPALVNLTVGSRPIYVFVAAMLAGMALAQMAVSDRRMKRAFVQAAPGTDG